MTSYYLATSWSRRKEMFVVRDELQAMGHTVTAQWLDSDDPVVPAGGVAADLGRSMSAAVTDIFDLATADEVMVFTGTPSTTGGYHVEFGVALAKSKPITIIGPRENVFQASTLVRQFDTWEDYVFFLEQKEQ